MSGLVNWILSWIAPKWLIVGSTTTTHKMDGRFWYDAHHLTLRETRTNRIARRRVPQLPDGGAGVFARFFGLPAQSSHGDLFMPDGSVIEADERRA